MSKRGYKNKGHGIYVDSRTGNYYHRPMIGHQRSWRKLHSETLTMARREISVMKTRALEARIGLSLDPYAQKITVGHLVEEWVKQGCQGRKCIPRAGDSLTRETERMKKWIPFFRGREARSINSEDCRDYHKWRIKHNKKKFRLDRSVDSELAGLTNLLWWASQNTRKTGLNVNPLVIKPRFDNSSLTRHCTAVMPMSDEALHKLASWLLESDRSQPLGWQFLLEALTGARTSEILACRLDAKHPLEAGYQDASALHLKRLKKGIKPWALLEAMPGHSPLAEMLIAFRNWHAQKFPECPWFIPGDYGNDCADRGALTHALRRACKNLDVPKVTSHGLRAYFVRALRSLGVDDSEVAKRLGHRSGVELVEQTYGISEPGWFGAKRMDFLPNEGKPAWHNWLPWPSIPEKIENVINLSAYHPHTNPYKIESDRIKKNPKNIVLAGR